MRILRFVLGDQLSHHISSLEEADPDQDGILLMEVLGEASYVPHHPKKIAFIFSAMRHFYQELKDKGFQSHYIKLEDERSLGSFLRR